MDFIAKFNQTSSDKFLNENDGTHAYLGTVLSGSYHTSIMNASIFEANKLEENVYYHCINVPAMQNGERLTSSEGIPLWNVTVVSKLSFSEYLQARKEFGEPRRLVKSAPKVDNNTPDPQQPEPIDETVKSKGKKVADDADPVITESVLNQKGEDFE